MDWRKVTVYTSSEATEIVTAMLEQTGITGCQVEDDKQIKQYMEETSKYWDYVDEELLNRPEGEARVIVYVSENPYGDEIFMRIKEGVQRLKGMDLGVDLGSLTIETEGNLDDEQWLNKWKDSYKPFTVGNKIFVKPVWEQAQAPDGRVTFVVDPGQVFGTGLHQTTQLCMTELEKYITDQSVVADLGCGSGILSVVAILLGAKSAYAVDIDANSIKTAYRNAELSGVDKSKYYVTSGDIITDEKLQNDIGFEKYDVVVANIIADVICSISPLAMKLLKKGGVFISSGIITERTEDVYNALKSAGFTVKDTKTKDDWVCITSVKE
ncbi:MAG TPA: 50S ribosomal protein L11 methyltransferase [Lachnospiraceae bacterium]|nr:50S ribosomal protein L11 methyltransferase [Lachnospiraceae bacterium]